MPREFKKKIILISIAMVLIAFVLETGWQISPPRRLSLQRPEFGYGANVADLDNVPRLREMGFQWMKGFVGWDGIEPKFWYYDWTNLSKATVAARDNGIGLLLRVDRTPDWARPSNDNPLAPPDPEYLSAWSDFIGNLARRGKGYVAAYEIWNEPNLAVEWGGNRPDPEYYVEMLRIAYQQIKAADPNALVVSAGLAPTQGDGGTEAMDNLVYLRQMYELGAGAYFDVLGSHPYGFASPPDADPRLDASFRSAELERQLMVEFGDSDKQVWATEAGWLLDPATVDLGACRDKPGVRAALWAAMDSQTAARYTTDAFSYAYKNWPWMDAIFLFNLDFSLAPWYSDPCEPMTFYSLLGPDGVPRPGFNALQDMPKVVSELQY